MILDITPSLERLRSAQSEYEAFEREVLGGAKNVAQLLEDHAIPQDMFMELGASLAAHMSMIEQVAQSDMASMPQLTMVSFLAAELYTDLKERYQLDTPTMRKATVLAQYTIMLSPISRQVELQDAELVDPPVPDAVPEQ